jgi:hypothetical protein
VPGRYLGPRFPRAPPHSVEQESRQSNTKTVVSIPAHDEAASTAADSLPFVLVRDKYHHENL